MKKLLLLVFISIYAVANSSSLGTILANESHCTDSLSYYNFTEVRGFITTDESFKPPLMRIPADGVYVAVFNQDDSIYLHSIDSIRQKIQREITSLTTEATGIFSFKLPVGEYIIHIDYDNNSISDPKHIPIQIDGTKSVINVGEVRLNQPIIVARCGEDESQKERQKTKRKSKKR